jgi:hypothetical protein
VLTWRFETLETKGVGGVDGTRTRGLRRDRPVPTIAQRCRTPENRGRLSRASAGGCQSWTRVSENLASSCKRVTDGSDSLGQRYLQLWSGAQDDDWRFSGHLPRETLEQSRFANAGGAPDFNVAADVERSPNLRQPFVPEQHSTADAVVDIGERILRGLCQTSARARVAALAGKPKQPSTKIFQQRRAGSIAAGGCDV